MTSYRVIEQNAAGENQLEIEINIDGADTGSWFTAPVTEGFLIFGFALLLAGKFASKSVKIPRPFFISLFRFRHFVIWFWILLSQSLHKLCYS